MTWCSWPDDYHLLHAVRGDLLTRLGREPEARAAFTRAAALTANSAEQRLLLGRARTQPSAISRNTVAHQQKLRCQASGEVTFSQVGRQGLEP